MNFKANSVIKRMLTFLMAFAMVATSLYVAPAANAEEIEGEEAVVEKEVVIDDGEDVEEEIIVDTEEEVADALTPGTPGALPNGTLAFTFTDGDSVQTSEKVYFAYAPKKSEIDAGPYTIGDYTPYSEGQDVKYYAATVTATTAKALNFQRSWWGYSAKAEEDSGWYIGIKAAPATTKTSFQYVMGGEDLPAEADWKTMTDTSSATLDVYTIRKNLSETSKTNAGSLNIWLREDAQNTPVKYTIDWSKITFNPAPDMTDLGQVKASVSGDIEIVQGDSDVISKIQKAVTLKYGQETLREKTQSGAGDFVWITRQQSGKIEDAVFDTIPYTEDTESEQNTKWKAALGVDVSNDAYAFKTIEDAGEENQNALCATVTILKSTTAGGTTKVEDVTDSAATLEAGEYDVVVRTGFASGSETPKVFFGMKDSKDTNPTCKLKVSKANDTAIISGVNDEAYAFLSGMTPPAKHLIDAAGDWPAAEKADLTDAEKKITVRNDGEITIDAKYTVRAPAIEIPYTAWSGFSSLEEEGEGNYVALMLKAPKDAENQTISSNQSVIYTASKDVFANGSKSGVESQKDYFVAVLMIKDKTKPVRYIIDWDGPSGKKYETALYSVDFSNVTLGTKLETAGKIRIAGRTAGTDNIVYGKEVDDLQRALGTIKYATSKADGTWSSAENATWKPATVTQAGYYAEITGLATKAGGTVSDTDLKTQKAGQYVATVTVKHYTVADGTATAGTESASINIPFTIGTVIEKNGTVTFGNAITGEKAYSGANQSAFTGLSITGLGQTVTYNSTEGVKKYQYTDSDGTTKHDVDVKLQKGTLIAGKKADSEDQKDYTWADVTEAKNVGIYRYALDIADEHVITLETQTSTAMFKITPKIIDTAAWFELEFKAADNGLDTRSITTGEGASAVTKTLLAYTGRSYVPANASVKLTTGIDSTYPENTTNSTDPDKVLAAAMRAEIAALPFTVEAGADDDVTNVGTAQNLYIKLADGYNFKIAEAGITMSNALEIQKSDKVDKLIVNGKAVSGGKVAIDAKADVKAGAQKAAFVANVKQPGGLRTEKFEKNSKSGVTSPTAADTFFSGKPDVSVADGMASLDFSPKTDATSGTAVLTIGLQNYDDIEVTVNLTALTDEDISKLKGESDAKGLTLEWKDRTETVVTSGTTKIGYLGRPFDRWDLKVSAKECKGTLDSNISYYYYRMASSTVAIPIGVKDIKDIGDYKVIAKFNYKPDGADAKEESYKSEFSFSIIAQEKLSANSTYAIPADDATGVVKADIAQAIRYGIADLYGWSIDASEVDIVYTSIPTSADGTQKTYQYKVDKGSALNAVSWRDNDTNKSVRSKVDGIVNLSAGAKDGELYTNQPYVVIKTKANSAKLAKNKAFAIGFDVLPKVQSGNGTESGTVNQVIYTVNFKTRKVTGGIVDDTLVATMKVAGGRTLDVEEAIKVGKVNDNVGAWINAATGKQWVDSDPVNSDLTLIGYIVADNTPAEGKVKGSAEGEKVSFEVVGIPDQVYTGKVIKPAVVVTRTDANNNTVVLKKGDLKITYDSTAKAVKDGYTVNVTVKKGKLYDADIALTGKFNIVPANLADVSNLTGKILVTNKKGVASYTAPKSLKIGKNSIKYGDGKDYLMTLVDPYADLPAGATEPTNLLDKNGKAKDITPGNYVLTITPAVDPTKGGNFVGEASAQIIVNSSDKLVSKAKKMVFDGKFATLGSEKGTMLDFDVTMGDGKTYSYKYDADLEMFEWVGDDPEINVYYSNTGRVGKAKVTLQGYGDKYFGERTYTYAVKAGANNLAKLKAAPSKAISAIKVPYRPTGWTLEEALATKGQTLESIGLSAKARENYVLSYKNTAKVGKASVTFTAVDYSGWTGSFTAKFTIEKLGLASTVKTELGGATGITADGANWTVDEGVVVLSADGKKVTTIDTTKIVLTDQYGKKLVEGTDYTVSKLQKVKKDKGVIKSGIITITGKGNYGLAKNAITVTYTAPAAESTETPAPAAK